MTEKFNGDALKTSRYYERFKKFIPTYETKQTKCKGDNDMYFTESVMKPLPMQLKGDMILIEKLPKPELTHKVGNVELIIADAKSHKETSRDAMTEFGLVLMVGEGHIFEDGTRAEMDLKVGDVILLPSSVVYYSQFAHMANYEQYTIGMMRAAQALLVFDDYMKAMEVLNA